MFGLCYRSYGNVSENFSCVGSIPYPASFIIASFNPDLCVAHEQYFIKQVEGSGSYGAGGPFAFAKVLLTLNTFYY